MFGIQKGCRFHSVSSQGFQIEEAAFGDGQNGKNVQSHEEIEHGFPAESILERHFFSQMINDKQSPEQRG